MVRSRSWTAMTMWSSGRVMAGVLSARCSGCQARGGAGVGVAHFGADVLRIAQQVEDGAGALHGLEQRIDLGAAGGRVDVHGVADLMRPDGRGLVAGLAAARIDDARDLDLQALHGHLALDRKSTRLNSSHT